TSWTYDASFPAFLKTVTGPFTPPGTPPAGARTVMRVYDSAKGNLLSSTSSGQEATYPSGSFSLLTVYTGYSPARQPLVIDPPGFGASDQTIYTYNVPNTNGFLPDTRTDPVVGALPGSPKTTFQYDLLNRRTDVTDPNGTTRHTV